MNRSLIKQTVVAAIVGALFVGVPAMATIESANAHGHLTVTEATTPATPPARAGHHALVVKAPATARPAAATHAAPKRAPRTTQVVSPAAAPATSTRLVSASRPPATTPVATTITHSATAPSVPAVQPRATPAVDAAQSGWGCGPALAWLATHAYPGYKFECPGYALGHQAMTCHNVPGVCPNGGRLIAIADPCPAAYMNEAHNSWVIEGKIPGPIDPYGYCH